MRCTSVKPGVECAFMTTKDVLTKAGFANRSWNNAVDAAARDSSFWLVLHRLPEPSTKWRNGICNLATHASASAASPEAKQKINPLKASKRSAGK